MDLDRAIVKSAGKGIPEIFAEHGERHFRDLEHKALVQALDGETPSVVACGGGTVVRPDNRTLLRDVTTVFLREDTDVLYRRTRGPGRPLRGASREEFGLRYAKRLPSTGRSRTSRSRPIGALRKRWPRRFWRACRDGSGPRRPSVQRLYRRRHRPRGDLLRFARTRTLRDLHRLDGGATACCAGARCPKTAGWRVAGKIEFPAGEASKSLDVYADSLRRLARMGLTRDGTIFALGGGVVGDLAGFVAGTYMRGIDLVMLPTSLLAMVDSAVGGKVGVDLPEGKNLVGAFVRPRLVAADLDWVATLPEREISNGLAEAIKMGLLSGGDFFGDLGLIGAARTGDLDALQTLVLDSVRFKARVVAEDELEGGLRAILNYGHTIGHALEAAAGYNLQHGRAVAAGMVAAASLSRKRFGRDLRSVHEDLVSTAGLPRRVPDVGSSARCSRWAATRNALPQTNPPGTDSCSSKTSAAPYGACP